MAKLFVSYFHQKSVFHLFLGTALRLLEISSINFVNHLAHGTTFLALEGLTKDSHLSHCTALRRLFWANAEMNCHCTQCEELPDVTGTEDLISSVKSWIMKSCPSKHIIRDCFVNWFETYERFFRDELASTLVHECISFDHTFKLASNIGYWRSDGKWVAQYDSAFFCYE